MLQLCIVCVTNEIIFSLLLLIDLVLIITTVYLQTESTCTVEATN